MGEHSEVSARRIVCTRGSTEDPCPCGFSLFQPSEPQNAPPTLAPVGTGGTDQHEDSRWVCRAGHGRQRHGPGAAAAWRTRTSCWRRAGGSKAPPARRRGRSASCSAGLEGKAPQGQQLVALSSLGVPPTPPADTGTTSSPLSPWLRPHCSAAAPEGQMGSVRDRASFRVCLISMTCFPVTKGSRPMSGGKSLEEQGSPQVPYLSSCLSDPARTSPYHCQVIKSSHGSWPAIWFICRGIRGADPHPCWDGWGAKEPLGFC